MCNTARDVSCRSQRPLLEHVRTFWCHQLPRLLRAGAMLTLNLRRPLVMGKPATRPQHISRAQQLPLQYAASHQQGMSVDPHNLQHWLTSLCSAPQLCLCHCQRQHRRDVHGSGQVPGSQWHVQLHVRHANPHSSGSSSRLGCMYLAPKPIVQPPCLVHLSYDILVTPSAAAAAQQRNALQVENDLQQSRPPCKPLPIFWGPSAASQNVHTSSHLEELCCIRCFCDTDLWGLDRRSPA